MLLLMSVHNYLAVSSMRDEDRVIECGVEEVFFFFNWILNGVFHLRFIALNFM